MQHISRRAVLAAAALLAGQAELSTAFAQLAAPPAGGAQTQIVPLYVSGQRPLVMLTLGDGLPSPVVFDTGTDENIVSTKYVEAAGLKKSGETTLVDAATGRSSTAATFALEDARLGGVAIHSPSAVELDIRRSDEVGIFGPNSFGDRLVVLDGALRRLRIVSRESAIALAGDGVPYRDNLPAMPITLQGRTLSAHIDTGNDSELVLGKGLLGKVRLKAPARVVGVAQSALGSQEVVGGQIDGDVIIGPLTLHDPEVTFSSEGEGANVGFPIASALTIVLDPAKKRSWVLDPRTAPAHLSDYVGQFGPRALRIEGGKLIHQRDGRPAFELRYLGGDLFEMPSTGDRIQFFRRGGRVVKLELITTEGSLVPADRG